MSNLIHPIVMNFLHIQAFLYNPALPNIKPAFKCMFLSIAELLNNSFMLNFMKQNYLPVDSRNSLFHWTYLLRKEQSKLYPNVYPSIEYSDFYKKYDAIEKNKTTWSHPTWDVTHYLAFINKGKWTKYKMESYKAFMSCLQFALPCEVCRNHIKDNLDKDNIDNYFKTGMLFEWSVNLHNIVNKMLEKPIVSIIEAYELVYKKI